MQMAPVDDNVGANDLSPEDFSRYAKKERIFAAMAAEAAENGYADTAVEDVLRRAGISRKTFYDLFANKEDCFLQAYDAASQRIRMTVGIAYHHAERLDLRLRDRVELALAAFLNTCAADPASAKMCIVEVLAAGPRARARRDAAVLDFAGFIDFPRTQARGTTAPSLVSEAIAGGIYGVVYSRIARGEAELLPTLLEELMDSGLGQLVEQDR